MFRNIDRIRLFYRYLDGNFDMQHMEGIEILLEHYCIHDDEKIKHFLKHWATFKAIHRGQPINKIREYFGESVAFYFAWIGFYQLFMLVAAVMGLIIFVLWMVFYGETTPGSDFSIIQILWITFAVVMSIWGTLFDQTWRRKESILAWTWGTRDYEANEAQRGDFKGVYKRDEVTGSMKKFRRSNILYKLRKTVSYSVVAVFFMIALICIVAILFYQFQVTNNPYGLVGCAALNAIQIRVTNILYDFIATKMNDWENHETDTVYNQNLATKMFLFRFFNSYISLFYIAFGKVSANLEIH